MAYEIIKKVKWKRRHTVIVACKECKDIKAVEFSHFNAGDYVCPCTKTKRLYNKYIWLIMFWYKIIDIKTWEGKFFDNSIVDCKCIECGLTKTIKLNSFMKNKATCNCIRKNCYVVSCHKELTKQIKTLLNSNKHNE